MSNEKHININSWKDGLNELSFLPGEPSLPLNDSWEKLGARLDVKKKNRKMPWYWIAAASIISCFMIIWKQENNKKEITAREIVQNKNNADKKENIQAAAPENKKEIFFISNIKKNKSKIPIANTIPDIQLQLATEDTTLIVIQNLKDPDSLVNIADIPIKQKQVVFNALKKKLPVVHINDLEKPVPATEAVAGNNDRPSFHVRLFNRDISPVSSEPDSGTILRIKLSPQN